MHVDEMNLGNFLLPAALLALMIRPASSYSGSLSKAKERPSELYQEYVAQLPSLAGKRVAITGASRGLGFVTSKFCAQKGAQVILLGRESEVAREALAAVREASADAGAPVPAFVEFDLTDFASVRKAAVAVKQCVGSEGLDVLCNNAGVMLQEDLPSKDGFDITISTNVLSHFLLTKDLIADLTKAAEQRGEARIVNMSSGSGFGEPGFNPVYFTRRGGNLGGPRASYDRYHQSKLANLCFTAALDDRIRTNGLKLKAMACTPGVCGTDMFLYATSVMQGIPSPRDMVPSAEDGSLSQLKCIADPTVESGELWGPKMGMGGLPTKVNLAPPTVLVNKEVKDELWRLCEDAVGEFNV